MSRVGSFRNSKHWLPHSEYFFAYSQGASSSQTNAFSCAWRRKFHFHSLESNLHLMHANYLVSLRALTKHQEYRSALHGRWPICRRNCVNNNAGAHNFTFRSETQILWASRVKTIHSQNVFNRVIWTLAVSTAFFRCMCCITKWYFIWLCTFYIHQRRILEKREPLISLAFSPISPIGIQKVSELVVCVWIAFFCVFVVKPPRSCNRHVPSLSAPFVFDGDRRR